MGHQKRSTVAMSDPHILRCFRILLFLLTGRLRFFVAKDTDWDNVAMMDFEWDYLSGET